PVYPTVVPEGDIGRLGEFIDQVYRREESQVIFVEIQVHILAQKLFQGLAVNLRIHISLHLGVFQTQADQGGEFSKFIAVLGIEGIDVLLVGKNIGKVLVHLKLARALVEGVQSVIVDL